MLSNFTSQLFPAPFLRRFICKSIFSNYKKCLLLIIQSAIEKCDKGNTTVVVGQDIYLLVFLIDRSPSDKDVKFLKQKQGNTSKRTYSS